MKELKIIKNITYTYITSDGTEFDDENEAKEWQEHLSEMENMTTLDADFNPTKCFDNIIYICANKQEQVDAFNAIAKSLGYYSNVDVPGYYRYDDISDSYVNVELQIKELQEIINKLKCAEHEKRRM